MEKALSLTQPWASLVILGEKQFETRSWFMGYQGSLWIHASKAWPGWAREICAEQPFQDVLCKHRLIAVRDFPLGAIIGRVDVIECHGTLPVYTQLLSDQELAFGDFSYGRYIIQLANARRLKKPIPVTGKLGLWQCDQYVAHLGEDAFVANS